MFQDWRKHIKDKPQLSPGLFWDMDMKTFDYHRNKELVAERVAERGTMTDFYAMLILYGGMKKVKDIYKNDVRSLNAKAMALICAVFKLKKEQLRCYTHKRLNLIPWDC